MFKKKRTFSFINGHGYLHFFLQSHTIIIVKQNKEVI